MNHDLNYLLHFDAVMDLVTQPTVGWVHINKPPIQRAFEFIDDTDFEEEDFNISGDCVATAASKGLKEFSTGIGDDLTVEDLFEFLKDLGIDITIDDIDITDVGGHGGPYEITIKGIVGDDLSDDFFFDSGYDDDHPDGDTTNDNNKADSTGNTHDRFDDALKGLI